MSFIISDKIDLTKAKLAHIRKELQGYYTGADLDTRAIETLEHFKSVDANPLLFQFMEETRVNQETYQTETFLGWQLKGADYGSVLIKD